MDACEDSDLKAELALPPDSRDGVSPKRCYLTFIAMRHRKSSTNYKLRRAWIKLPGNEFWLATNEFMNFSLQLSDEPAFEKKTDRCH